MGELHHRAGQTRQTRLAVAHVAGASDNWPTFPSEQTSDQQRATGTDGRDFRCTKSASLHGKTRHFVSADGRDGQSATPAQESKKPLATKGFDADCPPMSATVESAPKGLERLPDSAGKTDDSQFGGATVGAVGGDSAHFDAELQAVIEAWPALADDVKASILALVKPMHV